jgi:hypothetical protein
MAENQPVDDNARKGAVRRRSELDIKIMGETHWSKSSKEYGRFVDQKAEGDVHGRSAGAVISRQPRPGKAMTGARGR